MPKDTAGLDLLYASGVFDNDNELKILQVSAVPSLSAYGVFILLLMLISFGVVEVRRNI